MFVDHPLEYLSSFLVLGSLLELTAFAGRNPEGTLWDCKQHKWSPTSAERAFIKRMLAGSPNLQEAKNNLGC